MPSGRARGAVFGVSIRAGGQKKPTAVAWPWAAVWSPTQRGYLTGASIGGGVWDLKMTMDREGIHHSDVGGVGVDIDASGSAWMR